MYNATWPGTHSIEQTGLQLMCLPLTLLCYYTQLLVSLCNPGWPGTHHLNQAALKIAAILLPPPPEYWDCTLSYSGLYRT